MVVSVRRRVCLGRLGCGNALIGFAQDRDIEVTLRGVPLIPALVVATAVGVMIALGFWQLDRAEWKNNLLQRYATAGNMDEVVFPSSDQAEKQLYRRSAVTCERVVGMRETGARSQSGAQGWAHIANCEIGGGRQAEVSLGWTRAPEVVIWNGGPVRGILAPAGDLGARLVASEPPLAGLEPLPEPDPSELPNNHLAYAGQWFFFALTALIIFVLAVRRKKTAP